MNESTKTEAYRSKLSYNGTIPSKQYSRDILLVGERCWVEPLASALLMVQFDRFGQPQSPFDYHFQESNHDNINQKTSAKYPLSSSLSSSFHHLQTTKNDDDAAIGVLRKHVPMILPRKRYIHMIESLPTKPFWKHRMDHIVLVLPPISDRQVSQLLSRKESEHNLHHHLHKYQDIDPTSVLNWLHDDYIIFQRVTLIQIRDDSDRIGENSRNRTDMIHVNNSDNDKKRKRMEDPNQNSTLSSSSESSASTLLESLVQFSVHWGQPSSWRTVARMVLQRTALGTRQGSCHLPYVSPLIWKPFHQRNVLGEEE
jgi:hypothetical protein